VEKITVLIIDEQPFFRAGVRKALTEQTDFRILDCDPTEDPMGMVAAMYPDVVLLGSDLSNTNAIELGRTIARYYPNTRVVILSPDQNDVELFEAIKSAAVACLKKSVSVEDLGSIIRRAHKGEYPINDSLISRPNVARRVLKHFQDMSSMGRTLENIAAPLTRREGQILDHIAGGNTNNQIAHILGISEQTIKSHVSSILRKLNANDRAHAVALAMRNGWISIENKHKSVIEAT
jgi:DNA-binding NarL/FixJ family response regulator